ncbi:hypothetical protein DPMN_144796 [Dreissena polymorpha]|uniref:Uncharacterized protein n=1 Tax=Dreissena polymorpha TaxID=45954 RepID=A0A9D4J0M0_DREPO|nr:hypothetical protein DPMN_144796 [Dreissena polymorpha]
MLMTSFVSASGPQNMASKTVLRLTRTNVWQLIGLLESFATNVTSQSSCFSSIAMLVNENEYECCQAVAMLYVTAVLQ